MGSLAATSALACCQRQRVIGSARTARDARLQGLGQAFRRAFRRTKVHAPGFSQAARCDLASCCNGAPSLLPSQKIYHVCDGVPQDGGVMSGTDAGPTSAFTGGCSTGGTAMDRFDLKWPRTDATFYTDGWRCRIVWRQKGGLGGKLCSIICLL